MSDNPNYLGGGPKLIEAIKKYGKENFKREILENCETLEDFQKNIFYWIMDLKSIDPKIGYNILDRNAVKFLTEEELEKWKREERIRMLTKNSTDFFTHRKHWKQKRTGLF